MSQSSFTSRSVSPSWHRGPRGTHDRTL